MQNTHFEKPAIGGSVKRKIVNPDLAEERAKCTFDKSEVSWALADEYTLK
jgi:hypothetical protein